MTAKETKYDIVIVGAGVGGICAALAAARLRRSVLLVEEMKEIGGTGVHSAVSLICMFRDKNGRPINNGIHRELFPQAYTVGKGLFDVEETVPTYDEKELKEKYEALLKAEPLIAVWTDCKVTGVVTETDKIVSITVAPGEGEPVSVNGDFFLDATADGNLSAMAGAEFQIGREEDGKLQTATVTFKMTGFDPSKLQNSRIATWGGIRSLRQELTVHYKQLKEEGGTRNPRPSVLCFPYPDGRGILFNSTAVTDVDPTSAESVAAGMREGTEQALQLAEAVKRHPAFAEAEVEFVAPKLGVREGRRVIGDYVLTADDCLNARKFDDMVAACAYSLDIHDPLGGGAKLVKIGDPGYYHIPYRALIAKGRKNLLLSSRCISGTHEAHSSYRVMSGVSAIGEAAGTAAALAVWSKANDARDVSAARIRYVLQAGGQFVEGDVEKVTLK
ncbi:FAD-dependent oxidoreductase [Paenibacillus hemerocallicola]|uniref:FAD-dependent oxidoreductase n=1 Tax=Paenibacillus hemerocallicola TaxID=1172614 RepID=A0A5C4T8Y3_9BACL|nr:FAD-dependent oxidoreductase [Paenibacillus hemerocallicola]TNJ65553.1 FAD-dependent oxidoreductase [Paenibacillus hemerocallicola]